MTQVRPRRSVLYMPGSNERALEKAKTLAADALILDLEDAVAPDAKKDAREKVTAAVKKGGYGRREIIIRVNAIDSAWGVEDVVAAAGAAPDAILLPKVSHPDEVRKVAGMLDRSDSGRKIKLWAMIETPLAILNIGSIAALGGEATSRLACFVLGTNDLVKETRARADNGRYALLPWLTQTIIAARAYGLDVVDGVYNDFKDEAGFRGECEQGRTLGMDGKTLIHPSQVEVANGIFQPSAAEVEWSRKIIAAFALPENAGKGVITVDGRMTELLHCAMAQRTVAIAEAIEAMSSNG